jgi:hypothetical protein
MGVGGFEARLRAEVDALADENDLTLDKAFVAWAGERILDISTEDAVDAATFGGANDLGLDFGYIDEDSETIVLAQGKYSENVSRDAIRGLRGLPGILDDPAEVRRRKPNEEVADFARRFKARRKRGFKVRLLLLHLGKLGQPTAGEIADDLEDWGIDEIREASDRRSALEIPKPPTYIRLRVDRKLCFKLEDRPGKPRCWIVGVPLEEVNRLYHEHGTGLLARNVRLFAGKRTPANSAMADTLSSDAERSNFFYYNNGLCIVVSRIDKETYDNGRSLIGLHDPQIVNGGQTYFTVGHAEDDRLKGASVLARIICPPSEEKGEQFTDTVIRSTNTQTPVDSRDFHANDARQKSLTDKFSRLTPSWFYEPKVGLWETYEAKGKARFKIASPKSKLKFRVINNEELARCLLAWNGNPALPKTKSKRIFETGEDGLYNQIFPENCANDEFVHNALVAFELNIMILAEKSKWMEARRRARAEGNAEGLRELEQDGFVAFFNYFCLASMKYISDKYYPGRDYEFLTGEKQFEQTFDFLRRTYRFVIDNARKRDQASGRIFSLHNWFKQDSSFTDEVCAAIDNNMAFSKIGLPGTDR